MMTKKEKGKIVSYVKPSASFHLEADRCNRGVSLMLSGIIGVSEFSENIIHLQSHGGRIILNGSKLAMSVYDGGCVEVVGKLEGVQFKYGKT